MSHRTCRLLLTIAVFALTLGFAAPSVADQSGLTMTRAERYFERAVKREDSAAKHVSASCTRQTKSRASCSAEYEGSSEASDCRASADVRGRRSLRVTSFQRWCDRTFPQQLAHIWDFAKTNWLVVSLSGLGIVALVYLIAPRVGRSSAARRTGTASAATGAAPARHKETAAAAARRDELTATWHEALELFRTESPSQRADVAQRPGSYPPYECEIVAQRGSMRVGKSFVSNVVFGTNTYHEMRLIARQRPHPPDVTRPEDIASESFDSDDVHFEEFTAMHPKNQAEARKALNALDTKLTAAGWSSAGRGSQWYSYRYKRPMLR